jgi:hypothetical protein
MRPDPHYTFDKGYICLGGLYLGNLPPTIEVSGVKLNLKSEFHVSLICIRDISHLIDPKNDLEIQGEIVAEFKVFTTKQPLDKYEILNDFRFVQRDTKKTVIVMVSVPLLEDFFDVLRSKYTNNIPAQPTHITLYTLGTGAIGILTKEDLLRDSIPIKLPDLEASLIVQ